MNMSRNEAVRAMLAIIEDESIGRNDLNMESPGGCIAMRVLKTESKLFRLADMLDAIDLTFKSIVEPNDAFVRGEISRAEFHDRIAALLVPEEAA